MARGGVTPGTRYRIARGAPEALRAAGALLADPER